MATDDHMKVTAVGLPSGALSATFGRYELENGQHIEDVVLGYSTYGTLNEVRHPIDDALFTPRNARFTRFFFASERRRLPRRARPSRRTLGCSCLSLTACHSWCSLLSRCPGKLALFGMCDLDNRAAIISHILL